MAGLLAGIALGLMAHRVIDGPGVGIVRATWSCDSAACQTWNAVPALAFTQGSCPRLTIAVSDGHGSDIRAVLPAGEYHVAALLGDQRLVEVLAHQDITVSAGKTTRLGRMSVDPGGTPYPMFCD